MHIGSLTLDQVGRWWATQLTALLLPVSTRLTPRPLRQSLHRLIARSRMPRITLDATARTLTLHGPTADAPALITPLTPEGALALRRRLGGRRTARHPVAMALIVPGMPVLERDLHLPAALSAEASALARYEIELITPFTEADVFWSLSPPTRDNRTNTHRHRLTLTPRAPLGGWLALLDAAALTPVSLAPTNAPLTPQIMLRGRPPRTRRSRRIASALTVVIVMFAPFLWQSMQAHRLQRQIEALQPQRHLADQLRTRIETLTRSASLITQEAHRIGAPLPVLARLTEALPDGTYLDSFSLKDGHLTIEGQSTAAADLIGRIEQTKMIHDPRFSGPVLHQPDGGGESFSIDATLGQAPKHR